jgi:3'-5' exonuclease
VQDLFLDLETIPSHNPAVFHAITGRDEYRFLIGIGPIEPAANLKDPVKIAESIKQRTEAAERDLAERNESRMAARDKAWRDTALDGWNGHIGVIGFALDEAPVESITTIEVKYDRVADDEGKMVVTGDHVDVSCEKDNMESFFEFLGGQPFRVIDRRVCKFDILFLWQRCIVLGIRVPLWLTLAKESRLDSPYINDTSEMCGTTLSNKPFGPSLSSLCEALAIPTKGDINGSNVWDQIIAGNMTDVAGYCRWMSAAFAASGAASMAASIDGRHLRHGWKGRGLMLIAIGIIGIWIALAVIVLINFDDYPASARTGQVVLHAVDEEPTMTETNPAAEADKIVQQAIADAAKAGTTIKADAETIKTDIENDVDKVAADVKPAEAVAKTDARTVETEVRAGATTAAAAIQTAQAGVQAGVATTKAEITDVVAVKAHGVVANIIADISGFPFEISGELKEAGLKLKSAPPTPPAS